MAMGAPSPCQTRCRAGKARDGKALCRPTDGLKRRDCFQPMGGGNRQDFWWGAMIPAAGSLIEDIDDTVTVPERWKAVLWRLCRSVGATSGLLFTASGQPNAQALSARGLPSRSTVRRGEGIADEVGLKRPPFHPAKGLRPEGRNGAAACRLPLPPSTGDPAAVMLSRDARAFGRPLPPCRRWLRISAPAWRRTTGTGNGPDKAEGGKTPP
ncbi:hypothetical protein [Azospirillum picis]|uniref:Uncharacterized protein n=1 Tax=Azospirillum picis TaxID=488438 RepID=A0ABU0MUY1_9PROT|nr:hypothetical protein [Azospirillum picis]MBP2300895.1 hypothetical protein [Azospirillum picis]MDQ0536999.1 hypothetical protein [Azospirillum picis]